MQKKYIFLVKHLSNEKKYIADVIEMYCKLGTLWQDGDFRARQKLQNLVYPDGILYDKHLGSYRTENENEVFRIFHSISIGYIVEEEKAASEKSHLSPCVGIADEISNIKFIEDFDKIVNFMLATSHV